MSATTSTVTVEEVFRLSGRSLYDYLRWRAMELPAMRGLAKIRGLDTVADLRWRLGLAIPPATEDPLDF